MKSRTWALLLGAALLICLGLCVPLYMPREAAAAQIWSDGELVATLDLEQDRQLTVTGRHGTNVITVKDGVLAVTEADCPDGHCMRQPSDGPRIVCLPNRLVIKFTGSGELDSIVG